MPLLAVAEVVAEQMRAAVSAVLGDRLIYLAVHGSAASGDILAGYSDLDIYAVIDGSLDLTSALDLHERIRLIDPDPFSYLQPTLSRTDDPKALLVAGTFVTLIGSAPPTGAIQSEDALRRSGEEWLQQLPGLLQSDVLDWAFVTADEPRRARLCLTRLKPAVRALAVRSGAPPQAAWVASWDELVHGLSRADAEVAQVIAWMLETARRDGLRAASEVGSAALLALTLISDRHL